MTNRVNLFKAGEFSTPTAIVSLSEAIAAIQGDITPTESREAFIALSAQIKNSHSKDEKTLLKKQLPSVTFGGTFTGSRKVSNLEQASGLVVVDIDNVTPKKAKRISEDLKEDNHSVGVWESPSGFVKALFQVKLKSNGRIRSICNDRDYKKAVEGLNAYLKDEYGIKADEACKDITRLTFLSYDPDAYFNIEAECLIIEEKKEGERKPKENEKEKRLNISDEDADMETVQSIIDYLNEQGESLTSEYENWLSVAFALYSAFGEEGREFFHKFSQMDESYEADKVDEKYSEISKSSKGKVHIGTLIYLAQKKGYNLTPIRLEALEAADKEEGKKTDPYQWWMSFVKDYQIQVRYNETLGAIEVNGVGFEKWTQWDVAKAIVKIKAVALYSKAITTFEIFSAWATAEANNNPYNAMQEKINQLPFKGYGHIDRYLKGLKATNQDYWLTVGKKWIVSTVAQVLDEHFSNNTFLVLYGEKATGKSGFFEGLTGVGERYRLNPRRKDGGWMGSFSTQPTFSGSDEEKRQLARNVILFADEMRGFSKIKPEHLKAALGCRSVKYTPKYAENDRSFQRMASFCGTTNDSSILKESDRRVVVIEVVGKVDFKELNDIDMDALWAEARQLYLDGFDLSVSEEEMRLRTEVSKAFVDETPISEAVRELIVPIKADEKRQYENQLLTKEDVMRMVNTRLELMGFAKQTAVSAYTELNKALKEIGVDITKRVKLRGTRENRYLMVEARCYKGDEAEAEIVEVKESHKPKEVKSRKEEIEKAIEDLNNFMEVS